MKDDKKSQIIDMVWGYTLIEEQTSENNPEIKKLWDDFDKTWTEIEMNKLASDRKDFCMFLIKSIITILIGFSIIYWINS